MPRASIQVDVSQLNGVVVMAIHGEIDAATSLAVRTFFAEMEPNNLVILDCAEVDFMDFTGLNLLLALQSRMREHAGSLRIRRPSMPVRRIIECTSLHDVVEPTAA